MNQKTPALSVLLTNARRRAGQTQDQLAGLSTVSVRAIRDLEQGRVQHPRRETIRLLADALRLSEPRRLELELALDAPATGRVLQHEFSAELAAPPAALRPLIGRTGELEALTGLLAAPHVRQLTLVGLPGAGKTRLAQEAALRLHAKDRVPVLWITMDESAHELSGVAAGWSAPPTMTGWVRDLLRGGDTHDELADVIGAKPALIVLDGLNGAPATLRPLTKLLHSCKRLIVLATASTPIAVPNARLLTVAPLPVPEDVPDDAALGVSPAHAAVELMLTYSAHIRPDLLPTDSTVATLARICRCLDGVPGALENAATWLLLHSPEQVLDLARTTPHLLLDPVTAEATGDCGGYSRRVQETLDSLAPQALALLPVLAELAEPWTVKAAARAADLPFPEVARDVHALLVRGLVRQAPASSPGSPVAFRLLNLVRSFALERFDQPLPVPVSVH